MSNPTSTRGILGQFAEPKEALEAAEKVRDSEYTHFDFLTPFPVHGMDAAMGLGRSWVPWITAVLAFLGILSAQALINYVMVYDWPMIFGGKPFFSWPAWIPITFELMVLFSCVGSAIIAIWAGKRFTTPQPPPLAIKSDATVDKFVVWISATDPKFDASATRAFVESLGAKGVQLVDAEEGTHA